MPKLVKNELGIYRKLARINWEIKAEEYNKKVKNNELTEKEIKQEKLALLYTEPSLAVNQDDYVDLEEYPREVFNVFNEDDYGMDRQAFNGMKNLDELANIEELKDIKMLGIHDSLLENCDMAPLSKLKNLVEIDLFGDSEGGVKTKFYSSEALTNISSLKITGMHDLNFLKSFPNLKSLVIDFYTPSHGEEFELKTCNLNFLQKLNELTIINPSQYVIDEISQISNLKKLHTLMHIENLNFKKVNLPKLNLLTICGTFLEPFSNNADEFFNLPSLNKIQKDNNIHIEKEEELKSRNIEIIDISTKEIDKLFYNS